MCQQDDCGCGHPGHHAGHHSHWGMMHHPRGCCHPGQGLRRFPTREEVIARMEEYLKQLQAEAKGVEEHLAELKKTQA